jgi:hypothetical protein
MKIEIKNDTVKLKYINKFEIDNLKKRFSNLYFPENVNFWEQDITNIGEISPLLMGEVVEIGTKKLKNNELFTPSYLAIGDIVLFKVQHQLIYKDNDELYYIVGLGNIIAKIEEL